MAASRIEHRAEPLFQTSATSHFDGQRQAAGAMIQTGDLQ